MWPSAESIEPVWAFLEWAWDGVLAVVEGVANAFLSLWEWIRERRGG